MERSVAAAAVASVSAEAGAKALLCVLAVELLHPHSNSAIAEIPDMTRFILCLRTQVILSRKSEVFLNPICRFVQISILLQFRKSIIIKLIVYFYETV
jgi:hypothetical protein